MDDVNSVYVGGLSYESTEDTVKKAFLEFGEVVSVKIVYDRESGESRGFGFVSFTNPRSAMMAIRDMDGGQIEGRTIRVNEVRKNLKGLGFRDRDRDRDFRFRDRMPRRRDSSPRDRGNHRTRSPPLQRSPRSHTPIRGSPVRRGSSPANGRGSSPHAASVGRYPSPEPKERSRSERSSVSPQSSPDAPRKEESVHRSGSKVSSQQRNAQPDKEDEEVVRRLREELEKLRESRRGLEEKLVTLQGVVEKADVSIAALKSKSLKLEEALAAAQQLAAQRQFQLKRLQASVFTYKMATERLSQSEKAMKDLAALTSLELDHDHPHRTAAAADLANGHANVMEVEQNHHAPA